MRPLTLSMTAFGPYKHTEQIDFTLLQQQRLFLISGNTGAGKTTIYDAICFALYGAASGEDRYDVKMLRSHFAADDVHTSVDFCFELRGNTYRIFRQLAHVKTGNKHATGDRYECYQRRGGQDIPLTDRFMVTEVNKKIAEIIGLNKEQFKQIVMLPQGEFRKLLTSETENKEELLRSIFNTSFYQQVVERLKQKRNEQRAAYEQLNREQQLHIKSLINGLPKREESGFTALLAQEQYNTYQFLHVLEQEISYYLQEKELLQEKLKVEINHADRETTHYHQAKMINGRFQFLYQKQKELKELEKELPQISQKESQLLLAEKASQLEGVEQHDRDQKEWLQQKQLHLEKAKQMAQDAKVQDEQAQLDLERAEAKEQKKEMLVRELDRLQQFVPLIQELDKKEIQLKNLKQEVQRLEKQVRLITEEAAHLQEKMNIDTKQRRRLEEKVLNLPQKTDSLHQLRDTAKKLGHYIQLLDAAKKEQQQAERLKERFKQAETAYLLLENQWFEGQASQLALHLHQGEACPVCGSREHPRKAVTKGSLPSKEKVEQRRAELKKIEHAFHQQQAKQESIVHLLQQQRQEITVIPADQKQAEADYQKIVALGTQLKQEVEEGLHSQEQLIQLRQRLEEAEKNLNKRLTKKEEATLQWHAQQAQLVAEEALLRQQITSIPEPLRSMAQMEQHQAELEKQVQQVQAEQQAARKFAQQTREKYVTAQAALEGIANEVQEAIERSKQARHRFLLALDKVGFSSEIDYQQAKLSTAARAKLKEELQHFQTNQLTLSKQIAETLEELRDKKYLDLVQLELSLKNRNQEIELLRSRLQQQQQHVQTAQQGHRLIKETEKQIKEREEQFLLVQEVYELTHGNNTKKISFERYLLIEFLEQIIQAANLRLHQLSNGQYYLVRSNRLEKQGRQSGLGLDVYDNYTGQLRDVKTLSGGEKFNASLCLALGMTDMIQAFQGGVSIETMFIDEGFGSLDEESLQKAIDTLIDLQQSGRLIGLISHVPELKQAIPAVLEVTKSKEGYSRTQFIV